MVGWVQLRGRGFWVRDPAYRIWLALVVDHLVAEGAAKATRADRLSHAGKTWAQQLHDHCADLASYRFDGHVASNLDDFLATDAARQQALRLVQSCLAWVDSHATPEGDLRGVNMPLTAKMLGQHPTETAAPRVQRIGRAVLYLLEMSLHARASR